MNDSVSGLGRLQGRRVVITQADDYMGPATAELFAREGAEVIADSRDLTESPGPARRSSPRPARSTF
jgi:NAD(P)-dependent dehydrogenase (short-subunit alcohol dehydrogenase family)